MHEHSCRSRCPAGCGFTRRSFIQTSAAVAGTLVLGGCSSTQGPESESDLVRRIKPMGPAARCTPTVHACFVRRKEDYGMLWPGAVYDGEAALKSYTKQLADAAKEMKVNLKLREAPIYSPPEADAWCAEAIAAKPDGLYVIVLDRQMHAWPTAAKAAATNIPTIIYSPLGTSFTTNTEPLAQKKGCCIFSTDDFRQARYGLKMLAAGARMRATRCLVIAGTSTVDREIPHLGIKLHYIPASTFLELYERTPESPEVLALANDLIGHSKGMTGATKQDVINGIKSYVVARQLLEQEQADAISMDCLGALGKTKVSLPCIAWEKMNDHGIPAACEADVGAIATHIAVQYLFDRPGFQQDPVADTAMDAVIGAHCCCPTKLNGFGAAPEPYDIVHHHGSRDATARPKWRIGQRITMCDVIPGDAKKNTQVIIAAGAVLDNVSVPPAGGCVISIRAKFDSNTNVLAFPGFHQLFFYGDFKRELGYFCHLYNLDAVMA